jgi:AAA domain/UvrD-like helicase C-terminal domain
MSDSSVYSALRSSARLVVVEAPAGCGKTYQGAHYTREVAEQLKTGKLLILTHTHAAREVFHMRTVGCRSTVEIRTIDSLLAEIGSVYHETLGWPKDVGSWALQNDTFSEVAEKVNLLLQFAPAVVSAISARYPIIICDEHQDASAAQEAIILACLRAGSAVRIFGDPRQRVYSRGTAARKDAQRWDALKQAADHYETLDTPHRWSGEHKGLGQWIQERRRALWDDGVVDLRTPLPSAVKVITAENQAIHFGGYRLATEDGRPVWTLVRNSQSLLVLSSFNSTVSALRGVFSKDLSIWEGHVRDNLQDLVLAIETGHGAPEQIATAAVRFIQKVATGFSDSAYAKLLLNEVRTGCIGNRNGKPAKLQQLARILLESPNHHGIALFLRALEKTVKSEQAFAAIRLDSRREFWDAASLDAFESARDGLAELARRRSSTAHVMPRKALSTIHKAKGLECSDVLIIPCDGVHFKDSEEARCALYVAMSRGTKSLTFVVSRNNPSPLVMV